jgi:cobalt-zinc-cadmium efflux system outer membrane protein
MQCHSLSWLPGQRLPQHNTALLCLLLLVLLSGCVTFDQRAGFPEVSAAVEVRSGNRVTWNLGTDLEVEVAKEVRTLLQAPLTVEAAIQVALVNNRTLQALYADLGVAQADLVQAGLLKNPVFDADVLFALSGGRPDLDLSVALSFLDIFYLPLRKRVATARFEEAKLQVTGAVLDFAAMVRTAFYHHQANVQMFELLQTIGQGLTIGLEVTRRLYEAGNITDLDLVREQALLSEAKLLLRAAEVAGVRSRERLTTLMGLWGQDTAWQMVGRLPALPEQGLLTEGLEGRALQQSLDLASARQRLIVAGQQLGVQRATALVPDLEVGGRAERNDGAWEAGPSMTFPMPLFDQGQGRVGRSMVELRRAQQEYYALGVQIRSTARLLHEQMQGARDRALYYRDVLLPLLERIVNETQLQYNAMQLGVLEILRARERQIQAAVAYIEALREYWITRTDVELLLTGRLPQAADAAGRMERPRNMAGSAGH